MYDDDPGMADYEEFFYGPSREEMMDTKLDPKLTAIRKSFEPKEEYIADKMFPAAELQRRNMARKNEKLKRDSKLREEWLGREFELKLLDEIFGVEKLRMRLDVYNPVTDIVKMRPMWVPLGPHDTIQNRSLVPWSTDQFWSLLATGQITPV